ncbi:hypothetical protein F5050DRAFT_1802676 [Lentinula boryana]|uniref:IMS import disulfide relay-system CHCH-CHCH-like Cx9C domain-containing protein n=1 Tax=Lentinula boryana TaxID=40481 RepID=A0ABQ8QUS0_9AGAR|nr:hypothetical protein F5050DRAFT_1802676 [Lentinula boryana]
MHAAQEEVDGGCAMRGSLIMTPTIQTTKPLKRLAVHATTTCAKQASAYGKCILATYTDVRKDICKEEFDKFGRCLREAMKRKW